MTFWGFWWIGALFTTAYVQGADPTWGFFFQCLFCWPMELGEKLHKQRKGNDDE